MTANNAPEAEANMERRLSVILTQLLAADAKCKLSPSEDRYDERTLHMWRAFYQSLMLGYPCGVRIDPQEPAWPVVYIELPTGQVSWHIPEHTSPWDGHDFYEKQERMVNYGSYVTKRHRNG